MITFDFHISREARKKYNIDSSLLSITGNLILANFKQARQLSDSINNKRKEEGRSDQLVTAGELNALCILHEIFHLLIRKYEDQQNPGAIKRGIEYLKTELNEKELEKIFLTYLNHFPPPVIYKNEITAEEYLHGKTGDKNNTEIIFEELVLLHLENTNPAAAKFKEFFSDENLKSKTFYNNFIIKSEQFFAKEKPTGYGGIHLFSLLRRPIAVRPYNLFEQLDFVKNEWGIFIDESLLKKILSGKDLLSEDVKLFIKHGGGEKATPPVPVYKSPTEISGKKGKPNLLIEEVEQFTEDTDWIPHVVMLAKNIFVWLHQLSEKYGREIKTLDKIPDEELDRIASWNFTALWLIGIWERSSASQKIKKLTGNPEAAPSAYSLYDYVIADELGGENAFNNLKERAWYRGIRLASDMVPNHTGIFSKWIIEKPDYFIQTDSPPFPGYTFTGPDLSEDERVELRIEDKYYDRTDAAVVFERKDKFTGDARYIYHGNDGTSMPWNDTAQLNMLLPEVRESLIQTIMHVASKTPIIRFDAAMTLAKKHYQRLWFPEPGSGGAIPSRSDFAMTKEQFDQLMPVEFWREVVDRINESMPNVLLLAEAFWLMESYFVRTLGMHRVYNSAFMHMMMKEENEKYRQLIKNTLEFNPEILKRYVNFMSNPDEETAINQFGKGDKYFGVAVLMATMPGLPMFGHGQIEGFSEKYGMEYKRAYYDEVVDEHLVWRHTKEIFPLMKKRHLFSQVENFEFYDFIDKDGKLNNNVFAFSNKFGKESALVIYNNSYEQTEGSINFTCSKAVNGKAEKLSRRKIYKVFGFKPIHSYYYIYTDHRTELEYLISGKQIAEEGFKIKLFGYQYRICLNFKEVFDFDGRYAQLYRHLKGKGVVSIEESLKELELSSLHSTLESYLSADNLEKFRSILQYAAEVRKKKDEFTLPAKLKTGFKSLTKEVINTDKFQFDSKAIKRKFNSNIQLLQLFYGIWIRINRRKRVTKWIVNTNSVLPVNSDLSADEKLSTLMLVTVLSPFASTLKSIKKTNKFFDELLLSKPIRNIISKLSNDEISNSKTELINILLAAKFLIKKKYSSIILKSEKIKTNKDSTILSTLHFVLLDEEFVHKFLLVNQYEGITYFNKERFYKLNYWLLLLTAIHSVSESIKSLRKKGGGNNKQIRKTELEKELLKMVKEIFSESQKIISYADAAGYNLDKFLNEIKISKNKKYKLKRKTK